MSSIDIRPRRVPGEINRYTLHRPDAASRNIGRRSALNVCNMSESSPVACDNSTTYNDDCVTSRIYSAVLSEEDTITILENEPNSDGRLSQNTLPSYSACSANRCSSSEENDRPTCSIMNHRNHDPTRMSDTRRHFNPSLVPSTRERANLEHYSNQTCRSSIVSRLDCLRGNGQPIYFLLICLLFTTSCICDELCANLDTPGWTSPSTDITVKYGSPLDIYCILRQSTLDTKYPDKNATDLEFFRDGPREKIPQKYITVINKTTILLHIEDLPISSRKYYCQLKISKDAYEPVCLNQVTIGRIPQKPKFFDCYSKNWQNLVCSWKPVEQQTHTEYRLLFHFPRGREARSLYPCPQDKPQPMRMCTWSISSDPLYRQTHPFYMFRMNVRNAFGSRNYSFEFNHYANVIPAAPENLKVLNRTSESALLQWEISHHLYEFPPGLDHQIKYKNQLDHEETWKVINITNIPRERIIQYNLTELEYGNTGYDVRVFIKAVPAEREDRWSDFSTVTFRTLAKLPDYPPRTDIGSFEISEDNGNRDVYLYWQAIPRYQENGEHFKYDIVHVEENGRKITLSPIETTRTYARFKGISVHSYLFKIVSRNEIGRTEDYATIFVPKQQNMPREPIALTRIDFDNGVYELSWKPPIMNKPITNYTIFWCDNERDRPYQCMGYLDWIHVPRNTTMYNVTVPNRAKVYQFAISVNTNEGSSGMIWSSCTIMHNNVFSKMKSVWINRIGSHFIEVGWKLDCSDRIGIIEGFNIYYCPILSPYNVNCDGPKLNSTIKAGPHTIHGIVNDLKPYTTYMLSVAVLTKNGEGQHSEPLYNTTLEAAPSTPPFDVKINDVTNTTMFVKWKKPSAMNGVLRYYEVYYNGLTKKVDESNFVKLVDLLPYTNYSVSVAACTVACSKKSTTIYERTKIGVPGKVNMPKVRFINSSQVIVMWDPPVPPAGPMGVAFYEIQANYGEIYNGSKTEIQLPIPDCKTIDQEQQYTFRIRAVNIDPNNVILKGSWSDPGEGNCYSDGPSPRVWVIIWVIGSLVTIGFLTCIGYSSKRLWLKCQAMQDVEVKLPPGLAPNMKLLQKVDEQHIRQPSADSSGCSSGQGSVTSSLTAESQVSGDSGTVVEPISISPDKLLETLPVWEPTSLRQRGSTRGAGAVLSENTFRCRDSYVKVAKSGEPILDENLSLARSTPNLTDSTGYTISQQTWSSTGYISMPSFEELSSNPSPVPRETTTKTGGYSVIGSVSKSVRTSSEEDSDVNIMTDTAEDTLIKPEMKPVNNPYVSLASLEQKGEKHKPIDNFRDLEKLTALIEPNKKLKVDTLASHLTDPDKTPTSKPYVQTGLIDTLHKPFARNPTEQIAKSNIPICGSFASTSLTDSCKKPFVSSFVSPTSLPDSSLLTDTISPAIKPYIAVSAIPEITRSPSRAMEKNKESYSSTLSEDSSKPYVFANSVQQMLQQDSMESSANILEDIEENEDSPILFWQKADEKEPSVNPLHPNKMPIITKQSSGYVTIADNPSVMVSSHELFEKPPPPQMTINQSDEQYSKVTVVPNTIQ